MEEIKFRNRVLVSKYDGDVKFHDDMLGEGVWVNLNYNPFNNDWRYFNGISISKMAEILDKYDDAKTDIEIGLMRDIREAQ